MLFTNAERGRFAKDPAVVRFQGRYYLYYSLRHEGDRFGVGIAVSDDMENWHCCGEIPQDMPCEESGIAAPGAIVLNGQVHIFYQTYGNWRKDAICHAVSDDGLTFRKNPENPVFHPTDDWCAGRAIDADVCVWNGRLHLYFATRDHDMRVQKVGGAWAELDSGFGRSAWTQLASQALLMPELKWEGECIEAPATLVQEGKLYMFYGGSYNCTPQQIGCAVSEDGVFFRRTSSVPFIPCGVPGSWNSSESGHPYAFRDDNGRMYLFYQGSADGGRTWYLTKAEIKIENNMPHLV
jgi:beta-xylosidase